MKKTSIIVILSVAVIFAFGIFNYREYISEIPSRFAKYHNIINITVVDNEKILDLENTKVSYKSENDDLIDIQEISDGEVKFRKGMYGINTFMYDIPDKNITVEVGQFNTNWWHICEYDVSVYVADETVTLKVNITVNGDVKYYERTEPLHKDGNVISII